jgi:hypothetical protein
MKVFVNNQEVEIMLGMTVRHALIGAGLQKPLSNGTLVTDEWGNSIGMDGALDEGVKIIVGSETEAACPENI